MADGGRPVRAEWAFKQSETQGFRSASVPDMRGGVGGSRQAVLQEKYVAPDAVQTADPLAPPDDTEAAVVMEGDTRFVLREDTCLEGSA